MLSIRAAARRSRNDSRIALPSTTRRKRFRDEELFMPVLFHLTAPHEIAVPGLPFGVDGVVSPIQFHRAACPPLSLHISGGLPGSGSSTAQQDYITSFIRALTHRAGESWFRAAVGAVLCDDSHRNAPTGKRRSRPFPPGYTIFTRSSRPGDQEKR